MGLEKANLVLETHKKVACNAQIIVFNKDTGSLLELYPNAYNERLRHLYFVGYKKQNETKIVSAITNIMKYFQKYGYFCFFCSKTFSGKGSKHRCLTRKSCFACHKPVLNNETYVNLITQDLFCKKSDCPRDVCVQCNLSLENNKCKESHQKFVCRWGWMCSICKKYTFRSKYLRTVRDIQAKHQCDSFLCSFCGEKVLHIHKKKHLCPLYHLQKDKYAANLAFLQLSFSGQNAAWCLDCYKMGRICSFCEDHKLQQYPNIACLAVETEYGKFDAYTFSDTSLCDYVSYQKNFLQREYGYKLMDRAHGKKTSFNQFKTSKFSSFLFDDQFYGVIAQVLNFMLLKDFSNRTVLINCSETNELSFFIDVFTKHGISPKVLKNNSRILLVECAEMCLRLVDSQNYVALTFEQIASTENLSNYFFPKKWNKQSSYEYEGCCPPLSDFYCFDDSETDRIQKQNFVAKKKSWKFRHELRLHTLRKVFLTTTSILSFLSSTFEIQQILWRTKCNKHEEKFFLHPLTRPLLTGAGFIYQLFLRFCKDDLRMLQNPVEYQSSRGEVEFSEYLAHFLNRDDLIHAWSPLGQTKEFLPVCVPDIYDPVKQTLYFYNGCIIHNHDISKCLFKRNKSFQLCDKKDFFMKLKSLRTSTAIQIDVKVLWQCMWQQQKRLNPHVKNFIENIYTNPPTYRLDPRCAGIIHTKI